MEEHKITANVILTKEDHAQYSKLACKTIRRQLYGLQIVAIIVILTVLWQSTVLINEFFPIEEMKKNSEIVSIVTPFIFIVVIFILAHKISRYLKKFSNFSMLSQDGEMLLPKVITLDELGITQQSKYTKCFSKWEGVISIENDKKMIIFYIDKISAYVVPKHNFATEEESEAFYSNAVLLKRKTKTQSKVVNPWTRSIPHVPVNSQEEGE